ncbi:MAG: PaaI family thioesterase [Bacteroidaceae bacterium]|nr:PaaI family thioesterase [Bacteroidaceae bacterium]
MDTTTSEKIKAFFLHDEFARQNGITLVEVGDGYARTQVTIEGRHMNAGGGVQGGLLFTLADLAFAAATNGSGLLTVTSTANISFVSGATGGTITAEAREVVPHKKMPFVEVRISDETGRVLAMFTATGYRKSNVTLPFAEA